MTTALTKSANGHAMHQLPEDAQLRAQFIGALQHREILSARAERRGVAEALIMHWGSCLETDAELRLKQAEANLRQRFNENSLRIRPVDLDRGIALARRILESSRPTASAA